MDLTGLDPLTDEDLARRAIATPAAFQALYDRYARRVFGLLATMRLDPHAADDVAQQAWLKAWRGLSTKPTDSPFCPWLMRIVRNTAIDRSRLKKTAAIPENAPLAAGGHRDVLSDVEESAEMDRLRGCVAQLPELERKVFQNRLDGLGSPAIAAEAGLTSERVHRLFHDAKQRLQICLGVRS